MDATKVPAVLLGKRARGALAPEDSEEEESLAKRQRTEQDADERAEALCRILLSAAQAGYAEDVFPAAMVCKTLYHDQSLWAVLSGFRSAPDFNADSSRMTALQKQSRHFYGYRTPLMAAAKFNDLTRVGELLSWFRPASGASASSSSSSASMARADLIAAADVHGKTALHWAAECGNVEAVTVLLERGQADPNARDNEGGTALHACCRPDLTSAATYLQRLAVARALLAGDPVLNADVRIQDYRGRTALDLLCTKKEHVFWRAGVLETREDLICFLVKAGAKLRNPTAVFNAACEANMDALAEVLIETGQITANCAPALAVTISSATTSSQGTSSSSSASASAPSAKRTRSVPLYRPRAEDWPLLIAAKHGKEKLALRLMEDEDADPNIGLDCRQGILQLAAEQGMLSLVQRLVGAGAPLNCIAFGTNDEEEKGASTALILACLKGHAAVARFLVAAGAKVSLEDKLGRSAVVAACRDARDEELALLLLQSEYDLQHTPSSLQQSPWAAAASAGFTKALRWLVDAHLAGEDPLPYVLAGAFLKAVAAGQGEAASLLLKVVDYPFPPSVTAHKTFVSTSARPLIDACKTADKPAMAALAIELLQLEVLASSPQQPVDKKLLGAALVHAARNGSEALVTALLAHKAPVNHRAGKGKTALFKACSKGHTSVAKLLLPAGADPNICDERARSPLIVACCKGQVEVVKALLATKTTPPLNLDIAAADNPYSAAGYFCGTALDIVTKAPLPLLAGKDNTAADSHENDQYEELALMLINAGADVQVQRLLLRSQLICAAVRTRRHRVMMKLLEVREAAMPWHEDESGVEPPEARILAMAISEDREDAALQLLPAVKLRGHRPHIDDFATVCKLGRVKLAKAMIEQLGIDPNARASSIFSYEMVTPIHVAAAHGRSEVVDALMEAGADPNAKNIHGQTASHLACKNGHDLVVAALASNSQTNLDAKEMSGRTPLAFAFESKKESVVLALLSHEDEGQKRLALSEHVFSSGMPCQAPAGYELPVAPMLWRPIQIAAAKGWAAVVRRLLELGVPADCADHCGSTPLMHACAHGKADVVDTLLSKGADVHKASSAGESALFLAAKAGHAAIVSKLLASGADKEERNHAGDTPLLSACRLGHGLVVAALVDAGANVAVRNLTGESPLSVSWPRRCGTSVEALMRGGVVEACSKADLQAAVDAAFSDDIRRPPNTGFLEHLSRLVLSADLSVPFYAVAWALTVGNAHAADIFLGCVSDLPSASSMVNMLSKALYSRGLRAFCRLMEFWGKVFDGEDMEGEMKTEACGVFTKACQRGMVSAAKKAIFSGLEIDGSTLKSACASGVPSIVRAVLDTEAGSKLDLRKAMVASIGEGHTAVALLLLSHARKRGFECLSLNARFGELKRGFLHVAVSNRMLEVLSQLLLDGAWPDIKDAHGQPPLALACELQYADAASCLIDGNADLNIHEDGFDLLDPESSPALVKSLLTAGLKATRATLRRVVGAGGYNVCSLMLQAGADPSPSSGSSKLPLLIAVKEGYPELVPLLLHFGARPDQMRPGGTTALITSCFPGLAVEVTKMLLEAGATVDMQDYGGWTALRTACVVGSPDTIALLLAHGADPNGADNKGRTPLQLYRAFGAKQEARVAEQTTDRLLKAGAVDNENTQKRVRKNELPRHPGGLSRLFHSTIDDYYHVTLGPDSDDTEDDDDEDGDDGDSEDDNEDGEEEDDEDDDDEDDGDEEDEDDEDGDDNDEAGDANHDRDEDDDDEEDDNEDDGDDDDDQDEDDEDDNDEQDDNADDDDEDGHEDDEDDADDLSSEDERGHVGEGAEGDWADDEVLSDDGDARRTEGAADW